MRFKADDALRTDGCAMQRLSGELEPFAGKQLYIAAQLRQVEGDRASARDEDLVVGVSMFGVRIVRPIAPFAGRKSVAREPGRQRRRRNLAQVMFTPITVPTA